MEMKNAHHLYHAPGCPLRAPAPVLGPHVQRLLVPAAQFVSKYLGKSLAKFTEPEKYTGKAKEPQILKRFIRNVRTWLLVHGVSEESYLAIPLIGSCLNGPAGDWYDRIDKTQPLWPTDLSQAGNVVSAWPLSRIQEALEKRYVSQTSHRDAQGRWSHKTQTDRNGNLRTVGEQANKIEKIAEERYLTTDFEMKLKLVDTVKPEIADKLLEFCDVESPETTWDYLVEQAIKYERSYNQKQASRYARENGQRFSNYEAVTNSGSLAKRLKRQNGQRNTKKSESENSQNNSRRDRDRDRVPRDDRPAKPQQDRAPREEHQCNDHKPRRNGPKLEYTAAETAAYKTNLRDGLCFICKSKDHRANFHNDGQLKGIAFEDTENDPYSNDDGSNPLIYVEDGISYEFMQADEASAESESEATGEFESDWLTPSECGSLDLLSRSVDDLELDSGRKSIRTQRGSPAPAIIRDVPLDYDPLAYDPEELASESAEESDLENQNQHYTQILMHESDVSRSRTQFGERNASLPSESDYVLTPNNGKRPEAPAPKHSSHEILRT